jgi:hypothetical protein
MDIINKTKRPIAIKLPGGKVLRLGPGNTGQITAKAAEHPPVKKLLEEGVIEVSGDGGRHGTSGANSQSATSSAQGKMGGGGTARRSGDR